MRFKLILLSVLLITPLAAGAAGFATKSLFLSQTPVTEGDSVFIHAVVTNDSTGPFSGEVVFKDGDAKVGAVAVELAGGGAEAASVSWQPTAGSHKITAELTAADGTVAASESATFNVEAKPEESEQGAPQSTSSVESSEKIKETVASISPAAANAASPVFSTIDSLRQKSVEVLERGAEWAADKSAGEVAGESTGSSGIANTIMQIVATLLLYLLGALTWIVSSAGVFYPVLALIFFYLLWRLWKRYRR